jgi:hypothetical protein
VAVQRRLKLPCLSFWDLDLYGPLAKLFFKTCTRRVRVRFMRVWFWDFSCASGQLSLFPDTPPDHDKKAARVTQALDRIRARHGQGLIQYGRAA